MTDGIKRELLIFDCDPGCDDALALALVANSKSYKRLDILTVSGNVPVEQTTTNAYRLVALLKKEKLADGISVYQGCERGLMGDRPSAASVHGRDGLGDAPNNLVSDAIIKIKTSCQTEKISAVERLIALSKTKDSLFDLLCTGPLTNLATALNLMTYAQRLRFWKNCRSFVVMGGNFECQGNITPSAEFNIFFDPVAAQMVLDFLRKQNSGERKVDIHFVPLDSTETLAIPLSKQKRHATNAARFLFYAFQQYGEFHAFRCNRPKLVIPDFKENDYPELVIQEFKEEDYVKSQLGGSTGISKLNKFCYLHDPLAAWVLINDSNKDVKKSWKEATIRIDTGRGESRGKIIHCEPKTKKGPIPQPELGTKVKWLKLTKKSIRLEFLKQIAAILFLAKSIDT